MFDNTTVNLRGLATGIGSLPHKDAQAALDLIFQYCPDIPFWPQLPKRDIKEGMVAQFSQNLPCLKLKNDGLAFVRKDEELEVFYERIIAGDIEYFKLSEDYAQGLYAFKKRLQEQPELFNDIKFIKCHITGPFTFAAGINDERGLALLHDPVFLQVIVKGLEMKAIWQIKFFKEFNKKIIIFLDEPYLAGFGSAYTPINREDIAEDLRELTQGIKSEGALIGVHCCGNTDWSIFTDTMNIDILNFDAFSFLDKFIIYADSLKRFLKRGGIICWGIVPTQEFTGKETPDLLKDKIEKGIDILAKKGVDKDLLSKNLIVSPACGLGTLDVKKSENILKTLLETSLLLRKNT